MKKLLFVLLFGALFFANEIVGQSGSYGFPLYGLSSAPDSNYMIITRRYQGVPGVPFYEHADSIFAKFGGGGSGDNGIFGASNNGKSVAIDTANIGSELVFSQPNGLFSNTKLNSSRGINIDYISTDSSMYFNSLFGNQIDIKTTTNDTLKTGVFANNFPRIRLITGRRTPGTLNPFSQPVIKGQVIGAIDFAQRYTSNLGKNSLSIITIAKNNLYSKTIFEDGSLGGQVDTLPERRVLELDMETKDVTISNGDLTMGADTARINISDSLSILMPSGYGLSFGEEPFQFATRSVASAPRLMLNDDIGNPILRILNSNPVNGSGANPTISIEDGARSSWLIDMPVGLASQNSKGLSFRNYPSGSLAGGTFGSGVEYMQLNPSSGSSGRIVSVKPHQFTDSLFATAPLAVFDVANQLQIISDNSGSSQSRIVLNSTTSAGGTILQDRDPALTTNASEVILDHDGNTIIRGGDNQDIAIETSTSGNLQAIVDSIRINNLPSQPQHDDFEFELKANSNGYIVPFTRSYGYMAFDGTENITVTGGGSFDTLTNATNDMFSQIMQVGDFILDGDSIVIDRDGIVSIIVSFSINIPAAGIGEVKTLVNGTPQTGGAQVSNAVTADQRNFAYTTVVQASQGDVIKFGYNAVAGGNISVVAATVKIGFL